MFYLVVVEKTKPKLKRCIMLFLFATSICSLSAQIQSLNNYSGNWTDSSSWTNNEYPGIAINGDDITVYGEMLSSKCLEFNRAELTVVDTLVIHGNLLLKNTCSLTINTGGVLIVLGDYATNNKVDVLNNGLVLIAGKFEMQGADNQGSYINNGKTFVFDPDPEIKNGADYESIGCAESDSVCGYLDKLDYNADPISRYVAGLPYNIANISTDGNLCARPSVNVLVDRAEVCGYELVEISVEAAYVDEVDSLFCKFGQNAVPETAYGVGPHSVYYEEAGLKTIEIQYLSNSILYSDTLVEVHASANNVFEIRGGNFDESTPQVIENVCTGEQSVLQVIGDTSLLYRWQIPYLQIDETTSFRISIDWGNIVGVKNVLVSAVSAFGCDSKSVEGEVNIVSCYKEDIYSDRIYAFTPNKDGYNDYWIIKGIEDYPNAKIRVYSRSGRMVFESVGSYNNDWDGTYQGTVLPIDSYFYLIDLWEYNKEMVRGVVTILHE